MTEDIIREITPKAVEQLKYFIAESDKKEPEKEHMLRIGVEGGGCAGFQYRLDIEGIAKTNAKEPSNSLDTIVEKEGVKVIIDPMSLMYLKGISIDYVDGVYGTGFKILNPNAQGGCGCGHSFSA